MTDSKYHYEKQRAREDVQSEVEKDFARALTFSTCWMCS